MLFDEIYISDEDSVSEVVHDIILLLWNDVDNNIFPVLFCSRILLFTFYSVPWRKLLK